MAAPGFMEPPPPRRESLNDYFDNFFDENEDGSLFVRELSDQQIAEIEVIEKTMEDAHGFRLRAKSTHDRLDRHLQEYRRTTMIRFAKMGRLAELVSKDVKSAENDKLFFPDGLDKRAELFANVNFYLCYSAQRVKPRSIYDTKPRLATITNRRWSLLHWMRVYIDNAPTFRTLQARTNAAMYTAINQYGVNLTKKKKPYFGRHELVHLIDFDMNSTKAFEVAESHHLAWTLACVTGLRPGAIGRTRHRENSFLRFEHVRVTRDPKEPYKFHMLLTLPIMKGFQDVNRLEHGDEGELHLKILSPQNADNISIAPVYRLLAIALKRGFLANYKTVDELLLGNEVNIMFGEEHLGKPVFPAVTARGLGLYAEKSASAASFTAYLGKRARDAGYLSGTMYAFRRKAGTTVDRVAGRSAARAFLHHNPRSLTFEKAYEQTNFDLNVAAIAYAEDVESGVKDMTEMSSEVLYRAELHLTPTQQEQFVNEYVDRYAHPDVADARLERRRLKRIAMNGLRAEAQRLHKEKFTIQELHKRVNELRQPSKFAQRIQMRITESEQARHTRPPHQALQSEGPQDEEDDGGEEGTYDDELDLQDSDDDERDVGDELGIRCGDEDEEPNDTQDSEASDTEVGNTASSDVPKVAPTLLVAAAPPRGQGQPGMYNFNCNTASAWADKDQFADFTRESQEIWITTLESLQKATPPPGSPWPIKISAILARLNRVLNEPGSQVRALRQVSLTVDTDSPGDGDKIMQAPYELSVKTFLDIMLEGGEPTMSQCQECLADTTITGPAKFKIWKSPDALKRHVEGNIHSPLKQWYRKATIAQNRDPEGLARCVYGQECNRTYENLNKLQSYLEKLAERITAAEGSLDSDSHFSGLQADGWLSPTFKASRRSAVGGAKINARRNVSASALKSPRSNN